VTPLADGGYVLDEGALDRLAAFLVAGSLEACWRSARPARGSCSRRTNTVEPPSR
jgi:hypothetical protein